VQLVGVTGVVLGHHLDDARERDCPDAFLLPRAAAILLGCGRDQREVLRAGALESLQRRGERQVLIIAFFRDRVAAKIGQ
jgi:hypothetical protein